ESLGSPPWYHYPTTSVVTQPAMPSPQGSTTQTLLISSRRMSRAARSVRARQRLGGPSTGVKRAAVIPENDGDPAGIARATPALGMYELVRLQTEAGLNRSVAGVLRERADLIFRGQEWPVVAVSPRRVVVGARPADQLTRRPWPWVRKPPRLAPHGSPKTPLCLRRIRAVDEVFQDLEHVMASFT